MRSMKHERQKLRISWSARNKSARSSAGTSAILNARSLGPRDMMVRLRISSNLTISLPPDMSLGAGTRAILKR